MSSMRVALALTLVLAAGACGGGDAAAPSVTVTATGTWSGALLTGGGLNMALVENTATKVITGAGSLTFGSSSLPIQVLGTDSFPKVRLELQSNGFESAIFTGTLTATSLRGSLTGSGFAGDSVILAKN